MNKPVNLFTFAIHIIVYTVQVITIFHSLFLYAYIFDDFPRNLIKNGGFFRTITNWNLLIQWITFTITLFCDILSYVKPNAERTRLVRIRDTLFNSLALPLGIFISTGFWAMFLRDRKLLISESLMKLYNVWKNHALHTIPIVIALLDNCLIDHKRRDDKHGLKLLLLVMTSYTSLALFLGYYHDYWVYPYLRDMNHFMRLGFMVVHLAIPTLYYYIGGILYDLSWSNGHCANDCSMKITIDTIFSQMKKALNFMK